MSASCFGHLTTEIVLNKNEIGSRHYMSAEISSPSLPVHCIVRFHKPLVGISMTHSAVIRLSRGLLYLQHCYKRLKIRIFFFCLRGEFIISCKRHLHRITDYLHIRVHPQSSVDINTNLFSTYLHLLQTFLHMKSEVQRDHGILVHRNTGSLVQ